MTLHFSLPEASAYLGTTKIGEYRGLVLGWKVSSFNICSICLFTSYEFVGFCKI